jgi:hypothetical protein
MCNLSRCHCFPFIIHFTSVLWWLKASSILNEFLKSENYFFSSVVAIIASIINIQDLRIKYTMERSDTIVESNNKI